MKSVKAPPHKHNPPGLLGNTRGQAVVEYLLVVVIGVILVGMVAQFYKPFGTFVKFYFADHLQCLLETGELPGPGGAICGEELKSRLAQVSTDVKTGVQAGSKSGSGSNPNKSDSSTSQAKKGNPQANNSSSSPASSSASGGGGENGRGADVNSAGRQVIAGRIPLSQKDESSYTGSSAVSSGRFVGALGSGAKQSISTNYFIVDETPTGTRSIASSYSMRGKNGSEGDQLRPKKTRDTFKPRVASAGGGEDGGFSLGFAFRLLIIIAIILAIVLLVGGQLMQINRSMD